MIHVVVDDEGETNNELKKFETRTQIVSPLVSIRFRYRGIVKFIRYGTLKFRTTLRLHVYLFPLATNMPYPQYEGSRFEQDL